MKSSQPESRDDAGQRWAPFWERFERGSVDERLRLARDFLELDASPDPQAGRAAGGRGADQIDGETAFEVISHLLDPLRAAGRVAECDGLLVDLARRYPETYRTERCWFDKWRVENALLQPGAPVLPPLLDLVNAAALDVDSLFPLLEALCYHGRTDELIAATEVLVPRLESDDEVLRSTVAELRCFARDAHTARLLAEDPALASRDRRLRDALARFDPPEEAWLRELIDLVTGRRTTSFVPGEIRPGERASIRPLQLLHAEFLAHLRRRGWPHLKATLASNEMFTLLLDVPPPPTGVPKRGQPRTPAPRHRLLPDPAVARALVERASRSFQPPYHRVGGVLLSLVEWADFMAAKSLATREESLAFQHALRAHTPAALDLLRGAWDPGPAREVDSTLAPG